jgi:hypothetical protein
MTTTEPTSGLLVIPIEGPTRVVPIDTDTLTILQREVGGYIECVDAGDASTGTRGIDMWLNEEGKLQHLEGNERATYLYRREFTLGGDVMVGPAVLSRRTSGGDTIALSEDDITSIRATFDMLGWEA